MRRNKLSQSMQRVSSSSGRICQAVHRVRGRSEQAVRLGGHLPKLFGVLKGINMLPSPDMGVRDPSSLKPHKVSSLRCGTLRGPRIPGLLPHCVAALAHLRGGTNFAAHLSHGCSFPPSEYTFGGDPLRLAVSQNAGLTFELYQKFW